ncbi:MAG TPA: sigma 54-interacting transcriptional regulator, partial [Candidatus Sulfomarinibacteraceae bacterium]|nr:sigma 54-interacting transcriptional regulator [Candidatus Sulfomarinibacteraceae bacterium]
MNVAQEDLRKRLAFEIVLSELSSRFVNVGAADVDREIEEALRQVCKCLELDIAALWQLSPDEPGVFTMTHLFRVVDDPSVPEDFDARVYFPWALGKVISGDTVTLSSIDAAPVEAATDCETWRHFGIKSVFLFPLSTGGHRTFGAASFHSVEAERSYPDEIMRRLQLVSQIFANAVVRKRAEAELLESQERLQLAADAADIGMWALDIENQRFWGTDRARQIFGYEPDFDITMKAFLNSVHSDSRTPVSEEVRRALEEEREIDVEYRIVRPDGEVRWVYSRGRLRPATSTSPDVLMGASMDITERKDLEAKLVEQLRFEVLLSDVSARFVAVASEHVSREIEWALRDVGTFFGADRCGLLTAATNPRNVHANHVWYDTGIAQVAKELNLADLYPWAFDRLVVRKERLGFSSLEELPAEAGPDRESWIAEGVKSCLIVPLTSGDEVRHLLVIQCLRDECSWHESVVPRLQLLGTVLENALERRRAEEELERLRRQLELENAYLRQEHRLQLGQGRIVGESPAIMKVLGLVEQVAQTGSTVLIEGETGTGKELVAQRVHELSPRRDRPMVKVNCAALPSTLVESELFGHEKGAYTGAVSREPGRFEIADGSTIFLDEIAELPL